MGIDFSGLWSDLAGNKKASEIRELLKLTANPDIISFAGGLPNPQSFPVEELKEIAQVLEVSEPTVKRDWRFARAWLLARQDENA